MSVLEQEIADVRRFEEIVQILFEEGFGLVLSRLNLLHWVPLMDRLFTATRRVPPPERARHTFERLGPTFIKFGQILAQRPDLVPEAYRKELAKLEDSVEPFDAEQARQVIADELGDPDEIFQEFEDEPIAAASIAQVHRATLSTGEDVVVKIRRPGIKEQIETDLDILTSIAKHGERHSERLRKMRAHKYMAEFAQWTQDELDLKKERRNAQILQENLAEEDRVKIPDVYPSYNTEKVLVMERVDGVKCDNMAALEEMDVSGEEIAHTAIRAGLKQTVRDGFFHADPHPANFLINEDGQIVFLDFGMMGKFSRTTRRNLGLLFLHAANEDVDAAIDTVQRMAEIEDDADLEGLKQDVEESILLVRNSTIEDESITVALMDIAVKAANRGVHMPSSLMIMGKSLLTMEGIGMTLYPEFQVSDEIERMMRDILWEMNNPRQMMQTALIDVMENRDLFLRMPSQLNKLLDNLSTDSSTTVSVSGPDYRPAIIVAALLVASTVLFMEALPAQELLYVGAVQLIVAALLLLKAM